MASRFFDREIDPACRYCAAGTPTVDRKFILCPKRGVMEPSASCTAFRYDPLRREVRRRPALDVEGLTPEQFKL